MSDDYIPHIHPNMDEPIRSWSMQAGGFIFIEQGGQQVRIDPFELRDLLYSHTDEDYFRDTADSAAQSPATASGDHDGLPERLEAQATFVPETRMADVILEAALRSQSPAVPGDYDELLAEYDETVEWIMEFGVSREVAERSLAWALPTAPTPGDYDELLAEIERVRVEWESIYGQPNYAPNLTLAVQAADALRTEHRARVMVEADYEDVIQANTNWGHKYYDLTRRIEAALEKLTDTRETSEMRNRNAYGALTAPTETKGTKS
jgi:hypothetical protein